MTTVREIQQLVCQRYQLSRSALVGRHKHQGVALPRMLAMYLTRDLTTDSYPQMGRDFHRHHATVISDVRRVEEMLAYDWRVQEAVDELYDRLGTPARRRSARKHARRAA